ncbi:hypothetical protein NQ317_011341, partial [Molorchus minor]
MVDVKILSRINNSFKINAHCAVLSGASTVEEGVQLVSELNKMLNSAQFHLHKWNSNNTSILTGVTHSKSQGHVNINSEYPFSKVL